MAGTSTKRWDTDMRGRGVADASASVQAIQQLAELAGLPDWVTEEPEAHLLPRIRNRAAGAGLTVTAVQVESDGVLTVRLAEVSRLNRRELRQAVWTVLGGVVELSTHVRETQTAKSVTFDVVTGLAPGDGRFATHGHTLRLAVEQTAG